MTDIKKSTNLIYHDNINQIETDEFATGGPNGNINLAPKQLAENINYVKVTTEQALAEQQTQIDSVANGHYAYKTYAEMQAAAALPADDPLKLPANVTVDVVADTAELSKQYLYDGTEFLDSPHDLLVQAKAYTDIKKEELLTEINPNLTYAGDTAKSVDSSRNVYNYLNDIEGAWVNSNGSMTISAGTYTHTNTVSLGDALVFKTTAKPPHFIVGFSNNAVPSGAIKIAVQDRSIPGIVKVDVPAGYKYVHYNTRFVAGHDIQNTLIVNINKKDVVKYNDNNLVDAKARAELRHALTSESLTVTKFESDNLITPSSVHHNNYVLSLSPFNIAQGTGTEMVAIRVSEGETYSVYITNQAPLAFLVGLSSEPFKIGLQLTKATLQNGANANIKKFTVPVGMRWAYITTHLSSQSYDVRDSLYVSIGDMSADITPNLVSKVNGKSIIDELAHKRLESVMPNWSGLKYVSFGDSITWYDGKPYSQTHHESGQIARGYQSYVVDALNCVLDNQGYNGADITQIYATKVKPYNFSGAAVTTIMTGANDARKGVQIGSLQPIGSTFDTSTYLGALQASIEHIIAGNPAIKIFLMTPIRGWYNEHSTSNVPNTDPSIIGVMPRKYPDAVKDVANLYGLPVVDFYDSLGLNDLNKNYYLGDDPNKFSAYLLHPKNVGFKRMGEMLVNALK